MPMNRQTIEREFFRKLNSIVEPAVRRGLGSPRFLPGGLIVLETTGFKSGATRRTPLLATRLGRYIFVSTFRGQSSFWMKNLRKQPSISYYLGGRSRPAKAFVITGGEHSSNAGSLPPAIKRFTDFLAPYTQSGWAFAVLATGE